MESMSGNWQDRAACLRADPELFFPVGERARSDLDKIQAAKAFCVSCLVKEQCLEYALEKHEDFGIWGGMTEGERKALKRRAQQNRRRAHIERNTM